MCLATVLVGDDKPSQIYVRSKQKKAAEAGMQSRHVGCPTATQPGRARGQRRRRWPPIPTVHGILCQLPLPAGLDPEPVLRADPSREGRRRSHRASMGRLVRGQPGHVGCTPLGVMRLLERYDIPTAGKRAVVVGRSTLVGLPQVLLLGRKGVDATVTLAHSRTDRPGRRVPRGRHHRRLPPARRG